MALKKLAGKKTEEKSGQKSQKRILFVCTGNTCRSVMAAALARQALAAKPLAGASVEIGSAGLAALPGDGASPGAITVMGEKGVDLRGHGAVLLTRRDVEQADLVLTMSAGHREALVRLAPQCAGKIHTVAQYAGRHGDVPDPFGRDDQVYRQVAALLETLVVAALRRLGEEWAAEKI
ncbi:MAG: low molecular weight protein arginine phosphatase [Firmicutes bacterium]|nr:low molecular weight protein arginine phosphatase [Bacillota bacterium]